MTKILLIDNYDSFTHNIKHYFEMLECEVHILKNDDKRLLQKLDYTHLVLSPGPGKPENSGLTFQVIQNHYKTLPILGICLGHQCLSEFFGAKVTHAKEVMHGKISLLAHDNDTIFNNLPKCFNVVRYHSLIVSEKNFPDCLKVIAWIKNSEEIMAIRHKIYPLFGVQYHPEAILTEKGLEVLKNFLQLNLAN
jgi:anthranilate synthase/aminodeoxychorismate synthase-like glutamine amidotransferase